MDNQGINAETYIDQKTYNALIMGNRVFAGIVGLVACFFGEVIIKKTFESTKVMLAEGFEIISTKGE